MNISQEADYAVRCMLFLTERGGVRLIDAIAAEMKIPRSFAAKILQKLVRAGVVSSRRGVGGGFQLARESNQITLLEVVEAIEGPIALNKCVHEGESCELKGTCQTHPVWRELSGLVHAYLGQVSFAALIARAPLPEVSFAEGRKPRGGLRG